MEYATDRWFTEGRGAYDDGISRKDNPYPAKSDASGWWDHGWGVQQIIRDVYREEADGKHPKPRSRGRHD